MGDIADWYIDTMMDAYPDWSPFAYDVTCKFCGKRGLEWAHTGERWRLVGADGRFHVCKKTNVADDFDDLTGDLS